MLTFLVDPTIRDAFGFSPAYWAKERRHVKIMELLPNALKISKEELVEHVKAYWEAHGVSGGGGKKKKKGKGKKKK